MKADENKKNRFLKTKEIQQLLDDFHIQLHEVQSGHKNRALLQRCTTLEEIILQPKYYEFYNSFSRCTPKMSKNNRIFALAAIAGLLAHIRHDVRDDPFARQLRGKGSKPLLSPLRFRQLQEARDWNEFYHRLRRAIQLLGNKANIISLADGVLRWAKEQDHQNFPMMFSRQVMVDWAMDYFQATGEN